MASKLALHIQTPRLDDWCISSISSQVRNGNEMDFIEHVGPSPEPFGLPARGRFPPGMVEKLTTTGPNPARISKKPVINGLGPRQTS